MWISVEWKGSTGEGEKKSRADGYIGSEAAPTFLPCLRPGKNIASQRRPHATDDPVSDCCNVF